MSSCQVPFLDDETVEARIKIDLLIKNIETGLCRLSDRENGGVVQPVRSKLFIPGSNSLFGMMPCLSTHDNCLSAKIVSVFPENEAKFGLPCHQAVVFLFDSITGIPQAVIAANVLTSMRTAAATAVAVKHLSRSPLGVLAVIGSGHQARSHVNVLRRVGQWEEIRVFSRRQDRTASFASKFSVKACSTVQEAVVNADVIVTLTDSCLPVVQGGWVKRGALVCVIGACSPFQREVDDELMLSSQVITDSWAAAAVESGDIIQSKCSIEAELGEIIRGRKEVDWTRTRLFKSQGVAIEDLVAAKQILDSISNS